MDISGCCVSLCFQHECCFLKTPCQVFHWCVSKALLNIVFHLWHKRKHTHIQLHAMWKGLFTLYATYCYFEKTEKIKMTHDTVRLNLCPLNSPSSVTAGGLYAEVKGHCWCSSHFLFLYEWFQHLKSLASLFIS